MTQLGALAVVIAALAMLMALFAMLDTELDVRRRLGFGLEAVAFFVVTGQYWLAGSASAIGDPVLTFVQLLTVGMMIAVIYHVFAFVTTMRKRLQPMDDTTETDAPDTEVPQ